MKVESFECFPWEQFQPRSVSQTKVFSSLQCTTYLRSAKRLVRSQQHLEFSSKLPSKCYPRPMLLYVSDAVASSLTNVSNQRYFAPARETNSNEKKVWKAFFSRNKKMKKSPLFISAFLKMGLDSPENFCQVLNFKMLKGSSDYLNISEQKSRSLKLTAKKYYFYSLLPFVQH